MTVGDLHTYGKSASSNQVSPEKSAFLTLVKSDSRLLMPWVLREKNDKNTFQKKITVL